MAGGALTDLGEILASTYRGWRDHRVARLGAGLAYYGLFALVPLITVTVVVAARLVPFDDAVAVVARPLAELVAADVDEVEALLSERVSGVQTSAGIGVVGVVALLISASLLFVALQDALGVIWGVPYRPGLRHGIRRRLLAFGVVLVTSAVVIMTVAVDAVLGWVQRLLPFRDVGSMWGGDAAAWIAPVVLGAAALTLLYALLPPERVSRLAAAVAAVITAVALAGGIVATGWIVQLTAAPSAQGTAGLVLVLLTGFYVESQIVLVGAELCRVLSARWAR